MSIKESIKNEFLKTHLKYVYHTESPIIMHLWSAISACAGTMGRHTWVDWGIKKIYANNYCLLVGPPGTRKNVAINGAMSIVEDVTSIKLAPDDTGGQRQGLISSIVESQTNKLSEDISDMLDGFNIVDAFNEDPEGSLAKLSGTKISMHNQKYDAHTLFIKATEFGSFFGQGSLDMMRFLIKMWDGESYKYKLKRDEMILKDALVNILGGTTASDLSTLLPPEAIGKGFMSRVVLVHAPKKEKSVPPSEARFDKTYYDSLAEIYRYLHFDHTGAMKKTKQAVKYEDDVYGSNIKLDDTRFIYYSERRVDHLAKLAMVLAATNQRNVISLEDYEEANLILTETEKTMSDALGEYGLSPLSLSKQKMVEYIQHANGPVPADMLRAVMRKDMRLIDLNSAVVELLNARKIIEVKTKFGQAFMYNDETVTALDFVATKKQSTIS